MDETMSRDYPTGDYSLRLSRVRGVYSRFGICAVFDYLLDLGK